MGVKMHYMAELTGTTPRYQKCVCGLNRFCGTSAQERERNVAVGNPGPKGSPICLASCVGYGKQQQETSATSMQEAWSKVVVFSDTTSVTQVCTMYNSLSQHRAGS